MMQGSSVTATLILALVAVVTAPTSAMSETIDSVLTAKAKIALFADEQVRGRLITVETVKGVAEGSLGFRPIPRSDRDDRLERASPRADEETRVCEHLSGSAD